MDNTSIDYFANYRLLISLFPLLLGIALALFFARITYSVTLILIGLFIPVFAAIRNKMEITQEQIKDLKEASLLLKSGCNAHVNDQCTTLRCMEAIRNQDGKLLDWQFRGCSEYRASIIIDRITNLLES